MGHWKRDLRNLPTGLEDIITDESRGSVQKSPEKRIQAHAKMGTTPLASGPTVRVGLSYLDQTRNQPRNVIAVVL